jgi:hypothetical protein
MLWLGAGCPYAGNAAKMPNPFAAPREKFKSFGMYLQNCQGRDLVGAKSLKRAAGKNCCGGRPYTTRAGAWTCFLAITRQDSVIQPATYEECP